MKNKKILGLCVLVILFFSCKAKTNINNTNSESFLIEKKDETLLLQELIVYGDIKRCDEIQNINLQNECREKINYKNSIESGDIEQCNTIIDEKQKQNCKDYILFNEAIITKDITKCAKIENENSRNVCFENIK